MDMNIHTLNARFLSSKGFDWVDDLEFCPYINNDWQAANNINEAQSMDMRIGNGNESNNINVNGNGNGVNGNTLTSSNSSSIITNPTTPNTPCNYSTNSTVNNLNSISSTTSFNTPRAKKILEIVNPHTGMRVGSPKQV